MRNVTDILGETTYSYHCAGGFLHLYRDGDSICGGIFEDFPLLLKDMTKLKVLGKIWFSCCKIPEWLWEFCLSWVKDAPKQLYRGWHTLWQCCRINCWCSLVKKCQWKNSHAGHQRYQPAMGFMILLWGLRKCKHLFRTTLSRWWPPPIWTPSAATKGTVYPLDVLMGRRGKRSSSRPLIF